MEMYLWWSFCGFVCMIVYCGDALQMSMKVPFSGATCGGTFQLFVAVTDSCIWWWFVVMLSVMADMFVCWYLTFVSMVLVL